MSSLKIATTNEQQRLFFLIVNQGSGKVLSAADGGKLNPATQLSVAAGGASLARQLWQFTADGKFVTPDEKMLTRTVSSSKRSGTFVVDIDASSQSTDKECWRFGANGTITSCAQDASVLEVTGSSANENASVITFSLRQLNSASQRWFAVPRYLPLDFTPTRSSTAATSISFMIVNTASELALDVTAEGQAVVFGVDASSQTQWWQFRHSGAGLGIVNSRTLGALSLNSDGSVSVQTPGDVTEEMQNNQLWQFDLKGFIVSRQNGLVLEVPSNTDGTAITAITRKGNVTGLGMLFKSFSSDSQVFRVVPVKYRSDTQLQTASTSNTTSNPPGNSSQPISSNTPNTTAEELDDDSDIDDEFEDVDEELNLQQDDDDALDRALSAMTKLDNDITTRSDQHALDSALDVLDQLSADIAAPRSQQNEKFVKPAEPTFSTSFHCTAERAKLNPALNQITDHLYKMLKKDQRNYVQGKDLRPLLERSGLEQEVLLSVWGQVDAHNLGQISKHQLCTVLGLIAQAQAGDVASLATLDLGTVAPPKLEGIHVAYSEVWI